MLSRTNGGCYIKPLCSHAYFFSRNRRPYRGVNLPGFLGETRKMILYIYREREKPFLLVKSKVAILESLSVMMKVPKSLFVMIMMAHKFCCIASSKPSKTPSVHIKTAGSGCDPQMYDTLIGFDPLLSATRSRTPRRAAEQGRIVAVHCWKWNVEGCGTTNILVVRLVRLFQSKI